METTPSENKPLSGILVVDLSQFLAGPLATKILADLGATVIKVERAGVGDLTRRLYRITNNNTNILFEAINRNKYGIEIDLKSEEGKTTLKKLIKKCDVLIQNFRPKVLEKLGFGISTLKKLNPSLIYGSISGYGPLKRYDTKPGQDLLVQALSGSCFHGLRNQRGKPVPVGLAIADMSAGNCLAQGVLAALIQRQKDSSFRLVETSLMESLLDVYNLEVTAVLNNMIPEENRIFKEYQLFHNNQHWVAVFSDNTIHDQWFGGHPKQAPEDMMNKDFERYLKASRTIHSVTISPVQSWLELIERDIFDDLDMLHDVPSSLGEHITTTQLPIRFNGQRLTSNKGAPSLGEHDANYFL
ncbi:CoA transferase [Marinomonas sp. 15G1-11]|uniref:CoA transferase n=1 Tax=Marinomonas phaeophyticola TaxID=3004091 RepID=A0ABT4JY24_9GAMM|nr:CoA transferase [Marinomonas sp. 15G1-11]MCZ2722957.1 CoA transferase [Marinomonas sp. 15G1-11]